ncbi:SDR family oxidoreductase [Herbihabitans rhizosphaerae]|uniref:SDR family oxidoreductase n=1 Tax=Herbihabitans rhizosphaerae TaxID=1872711 RepID=UPI003BF7F1A9
MRDKVAVVTGATRGCGRAIAVELGRLGATVFVTGRTTREQASPMKRPETIEETAELVDAAGGRGIPVRCDYTSVADVDALRERVESEGRLDILVDDVWGGDQYLDWDNPYWESSLDDALTMVHNGIDTHLIALHRLLPLLTARPGGLVLEVTDGDTVNDETYPGPSIPYYLVKAAMRTLGRALGVELAKHGCVGLTVTPGFLRSEAMLEYFKVTEETWRDAITSGVGGDHGPHFAISETPYYLARGVAALALDPDAKRFAGKTMASWTLKREYGFTDLDGTQPDWGHWHDEVVKPGADPSTVDTSKYR